MIDWCCIAAVNDEAVLRANLAASPALAACPERLVVLRGQPSASAAYNAGLDATTARFCVFAHQDVYLPAGWDSTLADRIAQLDRIDPGWAVAGLFGVAGDGAHVGRVWSTGLGREIGAPIGVPVAVQSLDELLIILDRSRGIRFDAALPSFHLYGTDIVQIARAAGHRAYVIDAPVVHNSQPVRSLRGGFMAAHDHMRRKWRADLPIVTPVTRITRFGLRTRWQILKRDWRNRLRSTGPDAAGAGPRPDARGIARRLGYE